MREWHSALRKVLTCGNRRSDRTGVGTLSVFGEQLTFDNRDTFPAVTTKKLAMGQVAAELACFLRGYASLDEFHAMGCHIWDGNASATSGSKFVPSFGGDLGRIYGAQWRAWKSVDRDYQVRKTDQLEVLVEGLKANPFGRRHLVTAFNPGELDDVCLPPCHVMWQCYVREAERAWTETTPQPMSEHFLDVRVDMRSVDLFLGLPFDVASYAMLQRLLAKEVGMKSGWLIFQLGDAHIYLNHLAAVNEVLARDPFEPPLLSLDQHATLWNFMPENAKLLEYQHHPAVKAPLNT